MGQKQSKPPPVAEWMPPWIHAQPPRMRRLLSDGSVFLASQSTLCMGFGMASLMAKWGKVICHHHSLRASMVGLGLTASVFGATNALCFYVYMPKSAQIWGQWPYYASHHFMVPHVVICTLFSLIAFRQLGGRWISILPSDVRMTGAFARASLPAPKGKEYASPSQRTAIQRLGRRFGCHTCGQRRFASLFHGDHMPPNRYAHADTRSTLLKQSPYDRKTSRFKHVDESFVQRWVLSWQSKTKPLRKQQRFYPQCPTCSSHQSRAVRLNIPLLIAHWRLRVWRLYHVWIPIPFLWSLAISQPFY